jgi:hypothetical protein
MTGGSISNNSAVFGSGAGGGVYIVLGGQVNISGTAAISNNTAAYYGGGVRARDSGSSFTMGGSAIISGNTTTWASGNGGGVYLNQLASFTMNGGTIGGTYGSSAENKSNYGGGVHIGTAGVFIMNGGTISGNIATTKGGGGGVSVIGSASFTKTAGIIYGNNGGGNQNSAVDGNTKGHAVYVHAGLYNTVQYRDTNHTAGTLSFDGGTGYLSEGWGM